MIFYASMLMFLSSNAIAQTRKPIAYVYSGPGVCAGCDDSLLDAFEKAGYQALSIKPGEFTLENLAKASIISVPGGDQEGDVKTALKAGEAEAIKKYVQNGGHYLGVCMGAFLASPKLYTYAGAPKEYKRAAGSEDPGLDLFKGTVARLHDHLKAEYGTVIWKGKPKKVFLQDPPVFTVTDVNAEIWATYQERKGAIAAFQVPLGKGRVGMLAPHLEADPGWFEEDHLEIPKENRQKEFNDFLKALTRKSATEDCSPLVPQARTLQDTIKAATP